MLHPLYKLQSCVKLSVENSLKQYDELTVEPSKQPVETAENDGGNYNRDENDNAVFKNLLGCGPCDLLDFREKFLEILDRDLQNISHIKLNIER